ncbi:hypothetical protein EFE23_25010 [Micromonospora solifontis]|uniref:Secreted protein n=1 Tax=Micromonospora solifontis TaxID=2487138 RepID=A0ABX9W9Y1_9ACTN|nr:hypothetical protein EFE23_25010 [Micromonospora solifontis]
MSRRATVAAIFPGVMISAGPHGAAGIGWAGCRAARAGASVPRARRSPAAPLWSHRPPAVALVRPGQSPWPPA